MNFSDIINPYGTFDFIRDLYARISYSRFFEKSGFAICPLRYSFVLTERCNMSIPLEKEDKSNKDVLTKNQWLNLIEQIPFFAFITLIGIEHLSKEDYKEILFKASKKTLGKINIVTEGLSLDEDMADAIIEAKILLLSICLDKWGKNYDKTRGENGNFDKIQANLNALTQSCHIEKSKLMVDIKTTVLKDNLEDLLKIYQYATNQGFDFFSVSFLQNNKLKHNPVLYESFDEVFYKNNYPVELYFDIDKFEEIFWEIQKMKKFSKTKIRFSPKFENKNPKKEIDLIKKFFLEYNSKDIKEIYEPCRYPFANTIINAEGSVYPCLSCKMGNIKEQRLFEIINNPKYRCFRKNLKYSKVFSSCQLCPELNVKKT